MATTTILWAGKALGGQEEARLRKLVHTLRRRGLDETADDFTRFLPENDGAWTDDERRTGAAFGPDLSVDAEVDGDGGMRLTS